MRNKTQVNKEVLENASNLKFVGRLGVGLDNIDVEFCKTNNIHVQPATGMNANSVAEYVINTSLSLLKNIPLIHQETSIGNWPRTSISSKELKGKTIAPDVTVTNQLLPTNFNDCVRVVEKAIQSVISHNGIKRVVSPKSKIPSIVRIESIAIPRAAGTNSCWILMISMKTNIAE